MHVLKKMFFIRKVLSHFFVIRFTPVAFGEDVVTALSVLFLVEINVRFY